MPKPTGPPSSTPSQPPRSSLNLSRRELLAGAGAGAAALFLEQRSLQAEAPSHTAPGAQSATVVFTHTTVVNADDVQNDVALAVEGQSIVAIGPTDAVLEMYPRADIYDGPRSPRPGWGVIHLNGPDGVHIEIIMRPGR